MCLWKICADCQALKRYIVQKNNECINYSRFVVGENCATTTTSATGFCKQYTNTHYEISIGHVYMFPRSSAGAPLNNSNAYIRLSCEGRLTHILRLMFRLCL